MNSDAFNRVSADTDRRGLSDSARRQLMNRLIGQVFRYGKRRPHGLAYECNPA